MQVDMCQKYTPSRGKNNLGAIHTISLVHILLMTIWTNIYVKFD